MQPIQTILLIEDDHDIRVTFRLVLEEYGFFIHSVANGRDALSLLLKIPSPKLIILDINMPIMNGIEFLKHKEANPRLDSIPVLIVSCREDSLVLGKKYTQILKPVDFDTFGKTVEDCLSLINS